jgi:hypothetical protein
MSLSLVPRQLSSVQQARQAQPIHRVHRLDLVVSRRSEM